jgi:hypothetical protein
VGEENGENLTLLLWICIYISREETDIFVADLVIMAS